MPKVLVITNRKGGTGKTATSVNLSAEWAAQGLRVLLVDLDSQGHCALGLGVKVERDSPTLHGFMAGHHTFTEAIQKTKWEHLDLVPGDPLFDHGSGLTGDTRLRDALHCPEVANAYDLIVLDTPPSLDALLMNALCAADRVLVPFVPHFLASEGVRQLARVLFKVVSRGDNDRLKILGFLPVMKDLRISQHRQITEGLSKQFGVNRILPGIRTDIRLVEAFEAGQPLRVFAPHTRATADYAEASQLVLDLWQ
jgi:chromosome partitioning protein